jgi:mono/diheme cytochrome c family protein
MFLAAPLLTLLSLSGCGDPGYPDDLTYPVRTDLLVVKAPTKVPDTFFPDPPGNLEAGIEGMVKRAEEAGDTFEVYDPRKLTADLRKQIFDGLKTTFGTPAEPRVRATDASGSKSEVEEAVKELKLTEEMLRNGSRHYRRFCLQCHGVPGDGRGPSAPWLNPHPRDYRKGEFKFVSSVLGAGKESKPRREDLLRTLSHGVEGTSMPSFGLLTAQEREELVSYVIHLSIRGQCEMETIKTILKGELESGTTVEALIQGQLEELVLKYWLPSNKSLIKPESVPSIFAAEEKLAAETDPRKRAEALEKLKADREKAIVAGFTKLTTDQKLTCLGCHTDFGRQVGFKYDAWGTKVRPANWTLGVYRGGRRPIDLYWRIRAGIPPSTMTVTPRGAGEGALTDEDAWNIILFLQALPYPEMLPREVREKVYGKPKVPAEGEKKEHH